MTKKPERELEKAFYRAVRAAGGMTEKIAPTRKGIPDRLVLAPGGRMYLVELKTETGSLSPAQREWHRKARERGVEPVTLYGEAEIAAWVAAEL